MKGPRITEIVDEDEKPQQQKQQSFDAKYWVVMLYANWSVACLNFEAVLAKLSIKYDVPHLKFGNSHGNKTEKKLKHHSIAND